MQRLRDDVCVLRERAVGDAGDRDHRRPDLLDRVEQVDDLARLAAVRQHDEHVLGGQPTEVAVDRLGRV